ncbi:MAG: HK97 family phage prohead protease [Mogibacterium sp.]|nr:HK97 family phage prohead protease [Mogibacterium sp.]
MGKEKSYDFSGWATRCDIRCSDGRVIKPNAFKHCDGKTVPLVWQHQHNDPANVIGHAALEDRGSEGVYAYGYLNDTEQAKDVKELLKHGDIRSLSIYANKLKQEGSNVLHGVIRELSVVLAGANPGAFIDNVVLQHGVETYVEDECIYSSDQPVLVHACGGSSGGSEKKERKDMPTEKDKKVMVEIEKTEEKDIKDGKAMKQEKPEDAPEEAPQGDEGDQSEETIGDIFNTLNDKQKEAVYAMIGMAIEDAQKGNVPTESNGEGGDMEQSAFNNKEESMKHNIFEGEDPNGLNDTLSHDEMVGILRDAESVGSMKKAFLQHGIENIDYLFPDAKNVTDTPIFVQRRTDWVAPVMSGVHNTPFSRIKCLYADITEDEARALGYIKGEKKIDEVFSLLKRVTEPQTVYKHQSMDRDDVIDITDMDVVSWLKTEMRGMLDEELARAFLIGDGRLNSSQYKIKEDHIRPIWKDDEFYTIQAVIDADTLTSDEIAEKFIRQSIKARKEYKGSGNPTLFCTEDILTDCLLLEDLNKRRKYNTEQELATAMRVSKIISVPVMENQKRTLAGETKERTLQGLIVNLQDYNVGADKGGAVNMFDDFDIDYNKYKYLIETRCSGALIKPYSAICIETRKAATNVDKKKSEKKGN